MPREDTLVIGISEEDVAMGGDEVQKSSSEESTEIQKILKRLERLEEENETLKVKNKAMESLVKV